MLLFCIGPCEVCGQSCLPPLSSSTRSGQAPEWLLLQSLHLCDPEGKISCAESLTLEGGGSWGEWSWGSPDIPRELLGLGMIGFAGPGRHMLPAQDQISREQSSAYCQPMGVGKQLKVKSPFHRWGDQSLLCGGSYAGCCRYKNTAERPCPRVPVA